MKIHYSGSIGGPFGWGVFGENICRELAKRCELTTAGDADVVFTPIANETLAPAYPVRGKINIGLTFFESPLPDIAIENAKLYDLIFAGSTWCVDRLREKGIASKLLIQGVDQKIFHPAPGRKPDWQFRIFSGGKFEYRKGQDLVIAAFKEFSKAHPEAHLVCSWFNPWPQLIGGMKQSPHIILYENESPSQEMFFADMLCDNGLRRNQFTILTQLSQTRLSEEMGNTDCGLFPNRCEGGTNLVLMEYAACGRLPVMNRLTGHADLTIPDSITIKANEDENHWAVQEMGEIVKGLQIAYYSAEIQPKFPPKWTWTQTADTIASALTELKQNATIAI